MNMGGKRQKTLDIRQKTLDIRLQIYGFEYQAIIYFERKGRETIYRVSIKIIAYLQMNHVSANKPF